MGVLTQEVNLRTGIFIALGIIAVQAGALFLLGQPPICTCGDVKLWEGVVLSSGNSQHLSDWYTFSHIIHGFIFYFLLWLVFPRMSVGLRLAIAIGIEATWEMVENTPWVINKYREQALAQGYIGDSIINSACDTLAAVGGFFLARKFPVWSIIALALIFELGTAYIIRDNLTLNIIGFIHTFPAISAWQSGM